jgi:hypothetical protein
MDTIGSQYPFFFRNNMVKYKEIPISGLISYHMDEAQLFMTDEELGFTNIENNRMNTNAAPSIFNEAKMRTVELSNDNFNAERKFKLEVLEWLNNGQPKLFRSPTEGNYIVRLMNVSLSPEETLGRMLHTFNCTAYEIADYDYLNLKEYGFLINEDSNTPLWRFYAFDNFPSLFAHHDVPSAVWARIYGPEGTIYILAFENEAGGA